MFFGGDIENVEYTKLEDMTEEEIRAEKRKWQTTKPRARLEYWLMAHRLARKIDMRIMPMTAIIYLLCYLDRLNIGQSNMSKEAGYPANFHLC
jgi:hypothetical protein